MKKHFVTFYSPGTFFAEEDTKPIKSWDVATAVKMSKTITQRYGAKPYGFRFSTRERGPKDLDSKETKRSGMYYLNAKIETLEEIKKRKDPSESILLSNMMCNGWTAIVTNKDGDENWPWSQPLEKDDVVL